jgi:hypothetical protein
MAKTAIVSGANPALSRGDDPPYPPRSRLAGPMAKTAISSGAPNGTTSRTAAVPPDGMPSVSWPT